MDAISESDADQKGKEPRGMTLGHTLEA